MSIGYAIFLCHILKFTIIGFILFYLHLFYHYYMFSLIPETTIFKSLNNTFRYLMFSKRLVQLLLGHCKDLISHKGPCRPRGFNAISGQRVELRVADDLVVNEPIYLGETKHYRLETVEAFSSLSVVFEFVNAECYGMPGYFHTVVDSMLIGITSHVSNESMLSGNKNLMDYQKVD